MTQEDTEGASHYSIAAAHDSAAAVAASTEIESGAGGDSYVVTADIDTNDETKDVEFDSITLPESTHTLLFTEPINSRAFEFAIAICALSILCLLLALTNNGITNGLTRIPPNVGIAVKVAQFASIFIALLMEEEIPTGLYLLRRIPKQYFKSKFPELCFRKFVCSCLLRVFMGYLFLVNVMMILIQATNVLEIFFDFIALHFLQQLDDIAFNLARMGVFSKSLSGATTNKYFQTEFKREIMANKRSRRINFFLVSA